MTTPGTNDWIICVMTEIAYLRRRFPDAALIPCRESALLGRVLVGRAYITYLASCTPEAEKVRRYLPVIAGKRGTDPVLHNLEWTIEDRGPRR